MSLITFVNDAFTSHDHSLLFDNITVQSASFVTFIGSSGGAFSSSSAGSSSSSSAPVVLTRSSSAAAFSSAAVIASTAASISSSASVSSSSAAVVGDPQFVGLLGQSFQVHGLDGAVYALISEPAMQLNARFRFLTGPRPCPVMPSTGLRCAACWSHDGSYLSELGMLVAATGEAVGAVAGGASAGFTSVTVNGQQLAVGDSTPSRSITRLSTHELVLRAGSFVVEVESVDGFVNLRSVTTTVPRSQLASHGLLGQTWSSRTHQSTLRVIEGEVDDYVLADGTLFGTSFLYNRYTASTQ